MCVSLAEAGHLCAMAQPFQKSAPQNLKQSETRICNPSVPPSGNFAEVYQSPLSGAYSGAMTRRTAVVALSTLPIARYATALQQNRISPHETVSVGLSGKEL